MKIMPAYGVNVHEQRDGIQTNSGKSLEPSVIYQRVPHLGRNLIIGQNHCLISYHRLCNY